jgi:hypothetical protein
MQSANTNPLEAISIRWGFPRFTRSTAFRIFLAFEHQKKPTLLCTTKEKADPSSNSGASDLSRELHALTHGNHSLLSS